MLGRLLLLFILVPIVELALLIRVGGWIGFWPTVGIIFATGMIGAFLAKREGLSVWRRFTQRLQSGQLPGNELLDGIVVLVAGALLLTPGVLTDIVGMAGLLPLSRKWIRQMLLRRAQKALQAGSARFFYFGGSGAPSEYAEWEQADETPWPRGERPKDASGRLPETREDTGR